MTRKLFLLLCMTTPLGLFGQSPAYIKSNAVQADLSKPLSDTVYRMLSPFQVILVGEMHGTNEPAQFVTALANLLSQKGDSVQLGLEIPSGQMTAFLTEHTENSIYASDFFAKPLFESGRESVAWAQVIASLMNNPRVQLFFFDIEADTDPSANRDSLMYLNLKKQYFRHPNWKMVTISGNIHAMTSPEVQLRRNTMASFLKQDHLLNLSSRICSLNHYYLTGSCRANFGHGLEERKLDRPENDYDTSLDFSQYVLLKTPNSSYPYTGIFYTKLITPSQMLRP